MGTGPACSAYACGYNADQKGALEAILIMRFELLLGIRITHKINEKKVNQKPQSFAFERANSLAIYTLYR